MNKRQAKKKNKQLTDREKLWKANYRWVQSESWMYIVSPRFKRKTS